jgi:DeoR/GlpR family transcriptional regulator of sugar metabolism
LVRSQSTIRNDLAGLVPDTKPHRRKVISTLLGVSQQQISKDLTDLQPSSKPHRPKGGRPKGSGTKVYQRLIN